MTTLTIQIGFTVDICIFSYYFVSVLTPKKSKRMTFFLLLAVQISAMLILIPFSDELIFRGPLNMLISAILLICLFQDQYWKRFLVMFSYYVCSCVSEVLISLILYYVFGSRVFYPLDTITPEELRMLWLTQAAIFSTSFFFVKSIAIPLWSKRKFTPKNINTVLFVLLIAAQIITGALINTILFRYDIYEPPVLISYTLVVCLNVILILVFMLNVSQQTKKELEENSIREQLALQEKHYVEMGERYEKLRKLHHDFNNHIQVLHTLSDAGKHSEMSAYFDKLTKEFKSAESIRFSGNPAVDAVLLHKKETAASEGIRVDFQITLPSDCRFSEFDLCGVYSNLLDNAISACLTVEGERFIQLTTKVQAGYYGIIQTNSCHPSAVETGEKGDSHGYGMKIMNDIAKKYDGNTYYERRGDQFISVINIKISSAG